jgi:cytosine/adenosine deaminase-related metal-dependent hydrolase
MLETATLGGAKSLGMEHLIGTLESGKQADLAVVSLDHPAQEPLGDIHAALVFSSSGRDVSMTMVGGNVVHEQET